MNMDLVAFKIPSVMMQAEEEQKLREQIRMVVKLKPSSTTIDKKLEE